MTQALNIIYNVDAISHPLTGIGRDTHQLGLQLQQNPAVADLKLFSGGRWPNNFESLADNNRWLARARRFIPLKGLALRAYQKQRSRGLQRETNSLTGYILHSPNFILMPFDGPSLATIHDLSYIHYRQTQPKYRLRFLDREIPKTLKQARQIITVSQSVKAELMDVYGLADNQISVTRLGVDQRFKPLSVADCQEVLTTFDLSHRHYFLAVATREPRKNLLRLIQAYAGLPSITKEQYPLVLVGDRGWLNRELNQFIKRYQQHIRLSGYIDQAQLHQLYAAATMTLIPSLYEGFGLPIIESMACGTPVLTSDVGAMQEVAGGHALLCRPLQANDIKEKLQWAIDNPEWRQQAAVNGLNHSQQFTWQNCAEATIKAYEKALQ
ncbi:MAG: glycosyltransferase family 1 protein [Proteobacteria bacterium]|nr:MAG: glycosyltransferase family 1 protein [Pseudomonadota bacterium]